MDKTKLCIGCKLDKPLTDFYLSGRYYQSYCKNCANKNRNSARQADPLHREKQNAWRRANREKINAQTRVKRKPSSYVANEKTLFKAFKSRAKRKALELSMEFTLTLSEWQEILKIQEYTCALCFKSFSEKLKPSKDHILPITRGGPTTKENIQAVHKKCNTKKGDHTPSEFWLRKALDFFVEKDTILPQKDVLIDTVISELQKELPTTLEDYVRDLNI